jgi:hypothetical protein
MREPYVRAEEDLAAGIYVAWAHHSARNAVKYLIAALCG